jgi:hypothetical protein
MDLKKFYQKLRQVESEIMEPFPVVVTEETPDGGKAGQKAEVSRLNAARMIVEGRARLAQPADAAAYRESVEQALREAQQQALAQKVHLNVISAADLRALKAPPPAEKQ